jgi:transposase
VDDWAQRKGRTYGTIVVDLERRRPIDLLPDRTAETLASWLMTHPGVQIVSRDRAGAYADGVRQGAPQADQVADRWHVLVNVRQAVERWLARRHAAVRLANQAVATSDSPAPTESAGDHEPEPRAGSHLEQVQQARRARRLARYEAVVALKAQGFGERAIARTVRLARNTVRRYLHAEGFPERQPRRPRPTLLTPHEAYLQQRWLAGCTNATALWRELQTRGFTGGRSIVRGHVSRWRRHRAHHRTPPPRPVQRYSPRQTAWLILRPDHDLDEHERAYLLALTTHCPEATTVRDLVLQFGQLVRQRQADELANWAVAADQSGVPELRGFLLGLRRDWAAVEASLRLPWSNGQTEGQIHRLKLVKRQMAGRARLDLLRKQFLLTA